jgi:quercetin dioxygenase-like cupin family protein
MEIIKLGSQPSVKGPEDWFTGSVRINYLFQPNGHRRTGAAEVLGQEQHGTRIHLDKHLLLYHVGWVQREGDAVEEIKPGNIVWIAPGEKHWHGASATMAMTHIATQEELNGKVVDWMEKVSDAQYKNDN